MRDIDDGDTLRLQFADHLEQNIDFGSRQCRGRLVENEDAGIERDRLGDFDQLLLANRQVLDHCFGADAGIELVEELVGFLNLRLVVDATKTPGNLAGGENVFGDREVAEQVEFLEHHADAVLLGVGWRVELDFLAFEKNTAK